MIQMKSLSKILQVSDVFTSDPVLHHKCYSSSKEQKNYDNKHVILTSSS